MSTRRPRLHEGRDDEKQLIKVVNEIFDRQSQPGLVYFPAQATMNAFTCVGTVGDDPVAEGVVQAESDGDVPAIGVLTQSVITGATAIVRTSGRINGAVSGRAANDAIWVGPTGALVFAAPGVGNYVQRIGVCLNATDIFVGAGYPVI